jgi:hypothetical protein
VSFQEAALRSGIFAEKWRKKPSRRHLNSVNPVGASGIFEICGATVPAFHL